MAKIFTYSIKHKVKAIYFEDVSLQKMKEFRLLLSCFKSIEDTLEPMLKLQRTNSLKSKRLQLLTTFDCDGGLIPTGMKDVLKEFEELIVWEVAGGPGARVEVPGPQAGIDEEFDLANAAVDDIKNQLEDYLKEM